MENLLLSVVVLWLVGWLVGANVVGFCFSFFILSFFSLVFSSFFFPLLVDIVVCLLGFDP